MRSRTVLLAATLLAAGFWATAAALSPFVAQPAPGPQAPAVQPAPAHPPITLKPVPEITRTDGPTLYATLCADCHGATGRGDGRLVAQLGAAVPDLTRWTERHGSFDSGQVRDAISRVQMVPVEGADPWWEVMVDSYGFIRGNVMLSALTDHLETLQQQR